MRLSQYYAVKELTRYEVPIVDIANVTGLTTVMVQNIQEEVGVLPEVFLLQYDDDKKATRCPKCGGHVLEPCLKCWQEELGPDHVIEVIRRPEGHQSYMMNVHLFIPSTGDDIV